jgi:glycosyltransferase involved in cell wall biosynthesis
MIGSEATRVIEVANAQPLHDDAGGGPDGPRLAVVISCYNYERYIGRSIDSVREQNRDDCELVVIDDGSTDGSWDIIRRRGVRAFRIENGGQRAACLFGVDQTRAPFVLFLDADDELKSGSLAEIISHLGADVAKLQFALSLIDDNGNPRGGAFSVLEQFRDRQGLVREVLRRGVYKTPPTSGNVFRRDLCELLREADYDVAVDGVILFAAPLFGDVVSLSEELGYYRIHGRNDSGLGRGPSALALDRDIRRFLARMEHLRSIVRRLAPDLELVQPRETFYYRERTFCLDIITGRRPGLAALPSLLAHLALEPYPMMSKLALAVFFALGSSLSNTRAKSLLAYRLASEPRSALGLARAILSPANCPAVE